MAATLGGPKLYGSPTQSDLRLVLLGREGAGKGAVVKTILGRDKHRCDCEVGLCVKKQCEVSGRTVIIVDTPGWDSVKRTSSHIEREIKNSVTLCPPGPHALLIVVPIGDQLSSSDREAIQYYMELLSVRAWRYTMVLFVSEAEVKCTYNDKNLVVERAQSILVKCGGRHHHFECGSSTNQVSALLGKIDLLKAENEDEFFIPEVYYALLESKIPREMTEVIRVYEDREVSLKQRHTREMQEIKEQLRKYREAADSGRLGWTGSYELLPPNMNTETENRTGIQKEETVRKIHCPLHSNCTRSRRPEPGFRRERLTSR